MSANSLRVMKGAALSVVLLTWEDAGLSGLAVIQRCFWWCVHSIVEQSLWGGCWWVAFAGWQNRKCFRSQLWCRGHQGPSFVSTEMLFYSQKGSGRGSFIFILSKMRAFALCLCTKVTAALYWKKTTRISANECLKRLRLTADKVWKDENEQW